MHRCESCKGRAGLKQFLDEQLSDIDSESEFHYNQRDTTYARNTKMYSLMPLIN